jgi:Fe-S-cluster containining protein
MPRENALARLVRLHAAVDERAAELAALHGARLQCKRGCSACCVDAITVFEVEAERIRAHHEQLLARGAPHAAGACAFLDAEGACRVYADRPYVCRTQGLPLRWIDEERGAELRDICPLNESGAPIEQLPESSCWTLGETEARLAELQRAFGRDGERVALRALFERP